MTIQESMIMSMKIIYSEQIIEQLPEDKRGYFFELLNSIPDTLFDGIKDPRKAVIIGKKYASFLANLKEELKSAGVNIEIITEKQKELNSQLAKSLGVPASIAKRIK